MFEYTLPVLDSPSQQYLILTFRYRILVDLRPKALTGNTAEQSLERAGITCNKNAIPFDPEKPMVAVCIAVCVCADMCLYACMHACMACVCVHENLHVHLYIHAPTHTDRHRQTHPHRDQRDVAWWGGRAGSSMAGPSCPCDPRQLASLPGPG